MLINGLRELVIGDLRPVLPIVQGGMGVRVSLAGLACAVAEEGGIGVISSVGIGMNEPDFLTDFLGANIRAFRREIAQAKTRTKGVLGVNILVALSNYADYVRAAVEEKADIIFSGAGLPLRLPEFVRSGSHTKLVPIISSARAAVIICKRWIARYNRIPDAFVLEGPLAGGHLGFSAAELESNACKLETLLPQTLAAVAPFEAAHGQTIPIIAAGGIYTGADMHRFLRLGAAGVQLGTRFVTTHECDADAAFKQAYIDSQAADLIIIESPVGLLGRAIRNDFLDAVRRGERKPVRCPFRCIATCAGSRSPYCIAFALMAAQTGCLAEGFAFAGANAYRTDRILSVRELIATLLAEYTAAARGPVAEVAPGRSRVRCGIRPETVRSPQP